MKEKNNKLKKRTNFKNPRAGSKQEKGTRPHMYKIRSDSE